jgi:hypothetical protein
MLMRLRDGHEPDRHGWCGHPAHTHHWERYPCFTHRLADLVDDVPERMGLPEPRRWDRADGMT